MFVMLKGLLFYFSAENNYPSVFIFTSYHSSMNIMSSGVHSNRTLSCEKR